MKRKIVVGAENLNVHAAIKKCLSATRVEGKWDGPSIYCTVN
jgi:hypothetical protein